MRLFCAIELPDAPRASLSRQIGKLRGRWPGAAWVRPENLHLTLRFFGEVAEGDAAALCDALARVPRTGAIELRLDGAECLPPRGTGRVLCAALAGDLDRLVGLAAAIEREAVGMSLPAERRRFHPHVTLARARSPWAPADRAELLRQGSEGMEGVTFEVEDFSVFESVLGSAGPLYVRLAKFEIV